MSATSIKMGGRSFTSIHEMAENIKREIRAELISESYRRIDYVNICILSFEKYFFRNGSYASLSVVLTENGDEKTADIVGSGGGEGLFNISWGANSEFAQDAENILKRFGLSTSEKR